MSLAPDQAKRLQTALHQATSVPSSSKAKEILTDGTVHGHALTKKQKGFFGLLAGGGHPTRRS